MNTKIIGVIVAVILLLGIGGAYFLNQNKTATQKSESETTTTTENKTSSLLDLLSLGKNQVCTFNTTSSNSNVEGTFYIAGEKLRGNFKTTVDEKTEEMSMIRDGNTTYIWGPSLPTGIKMTLSLDDISSNEQTNQYVNTTEKLNYDCNDWIVDSSLFTPPSNIKFSELPSSLLPKTTGTTTNNQSDSNLCAQITDPTAKAACENAMQ